MTVTREMLDNLPRRGTTEAASTYPAIAHIRGSRHECAWCDFTGHPWTVMTHEDRSHPESLGYRE